MEMHRAHKLFAGFRAVEKIHDEKLSASNSNGRLISLIENSMIKISFR